MKEESKAIQELAKTTGKAIEAAREAGGFIAKFIAGPLEQGVGIFEDRLKYMRWERQVRLMHRAEELLKLSGLKAPNRPVPIKIAIPIMQGATLEEDDLLQDRWAALLVNAGNASFLGEIRRSYASILEQLTSLDARILDVLYSLPFDQSQHNGIVTAELPDKARIREEKEKGETELPSEEIVIALSNLARLGCLRPGMTWGGGESYRKVNPTIAGKAFVMACRVHGA
ncbi:MAG: Abi-alpha family protein [Burkholderiales bacterium]|nr:Abi-alpha family protein [Burkholderiales bacterium]